MGYPKDIDDYTTEELKAEIKRRSDCRKENECPYCGGLTRNKRKALQLPTHTCKFLGSAAFKRFYGYEP